MPFFIQIRYLYSAWKILSLKTVKDEGAALELVTNFTFDGSLGVPEVVSLPSPVISYEAEVVVEYLDSMFFPYFEIRGCPYEGEQKRRLENIL